MPRPSPPRGYDETVPTILPRLADVNPGSVTRALAQAFAEEYAKLHAQMQAVYDAAFVDAATGDDLDALVKLLAFQRRRVESLHAEAEGLVRTRGVQTAPKLGKKKPKKRKKGAKRRRST